MQYNNLTDTWTNLHSWKWERMLTYLKVCNLKVRVQGTYCIEPVRRISWPWMCGKEGESVQEEARSDTLSHLLRMLRLWKQQASASLVLILSPQEPNDWISSRWNRELLSPLAWKIPWTEEPGKLQSMGLLRVEHEWATSLSLFTFMHWRRTWQPTPVFLPGESQGRRNLVGCRLWGHTESDTTEVT